MRLLVLFTIVSTLFLKSCAPSLHQLENYELVQSLEDGYLIVTLENHTEEILLLKKYGQHKKAERIAKRDAKHNSHIKQAIAKNYDFSDILFTYANKHSDSITYETIDGESVELANKNKVFNLSFYNTINYSNDSENEEQLLALKIAPKYDSFLESSAITVEAKVNKGLHGYSHLLKKMNHKLYRLEKNAEENLVYSQP